jgi:hypothetical protein
MTASTRARGRGAPVVALLGAAVTSLAFQAAALALVDSLPSIEYLAFGSKASGAHGVGQGLDGLLEEAGNPAGFLVLSTRHAAARELVPGI